MGESSMGAYNDNAQCLNVVRLCECQLQVSISVTIVQVDDELNS